MRFSQPERTDHVPNYFFRLERLRRSSTRLKYCPHDLTNVGHLNCCSRFVGVTFLSLQQLIGNQGIDLQVQEPCVCG